MTEKSQDKRTQILEAATRVLTTRGLPSLTFEAVAEEAGLSRQLVRYYYADQETLMTRLCDHLGAGYRDILVAGILQVGQVERLKFFLDFFFDLADGHRMPDNLEAYDALLAYSVGSAPFRDRMCLQYKTLGDVMTHELQIAHPSLEGAAAEELSFLFVSMMHAHWSFVATLGHSREHSKLARKAMDRLIQSYLDDADFTPAMAKPWARNAS